MLAGPATLTAPPAVAAAHDVLDVARVARTDVRFIGDYNVCHVETANERARRMEYGCFYGVATLAGPWRLVCGRL